MPRPKPPEPLRGRQIRLSDKQFIIFKYLGGAEWLRKTLEKKDPFPKKYYDVLLKTGGRHALRKQTPSIQERICTTES